MAITGLSLDLKPHKEEEHCHEGIVDPKDQRPRNLPFAEGDFGYDQQKFSIIVRKSCVVARDEGEDGGNQQNKAGSRFMIDESDQRLHATPPVLSCRNSR